jgi:hypothetical protein
MDRSTLLRNFVKDFFSKEDAANLAAVANVVFKDKKQLRAILQGGNKNFIHWFLILVGLLYFWVTIEQTEKSKIDTLNRSLEDFLIQNFKENNVSYTFEYNEDGSREVVPLLRGGSSHILMNIFRNMSKEDQETIRTMTQNLLTSSEKSKLKRDFRVILMGGKIDARKCFNKEDPVQFVSYVDEQDEDGQKLREKDVIRVRPSNQDISSIPSIKDHQWCYLKETLRSLRDTNQLKNVITLREWTPDQLFSIQEQLLPITPFLILSYLTYVGTLYVIYLVEKINPYGDPERAKEVLSINYRIVELIFLTLIHFYIRVL